MELSKKDVSKKNPHGKDEKKDELCFCGLLYSFFVQKTEGWYNYLLSVIQH